MNNGGIPNRPTKVWGKVISSTNVHEANRNEFFGMPFLSFFKWQAKK
jgi:hypothetical protein